MHIRFFVAFFLLVIKFNFSFADYGIDSIPNINKPDSLREYIVVNIEIEGNKVTRPSIIFRELMFSLGDTLKVDQKHLEEIMLTSKNNLTNSRLFTVVFLTHQENIKGQLSVNIKVQERLYTWPAPIFEIAGGNNFNSWLHDKDFSRTNYGFYITRYNFRGRDETITLNVQGGYTENVSLTYTVPYLNKKQRGGLGFVIKYSRNHEFPYATLNNKLIFYKTFSQYIRKYFQTGLKYTYRQGIYNTHKSNFYYNTISIADTIVRLNPDYLGNGYSGLKYINVDYQFERDCRNVQAYPLKGYYFGYVLGTYFTSKIKDHFNTIYFATAYNRYLKLSDRFYYAASIKAKLSSPGQTAYYDQRGLGYGADIVRGYEYYVIDGQHYGLLKTTLKYELIKPRIVKTKLIPFDKFNTIPYAMYFNIHGDAGYVKDDYMFRNNPKCNTLLLGSGIGMDYVTYYDMVLRIEYSINKFGEKGIFLNFSAQL